jgi:signal transduction histidine kinase
MFTSSISNTPLLIQGSDAHLRRTFAQIVTNAVEAMENGGSLSIHASKGATPGPGSGLALVEISDTGCGIGEADLPRIFEPYFSTKTDTHSAAGLSLAIVYDIVRRHNGDAEVQSAVGEGTRFALTFPLLEKQP